MNFVTHLRHVPPPVYYTKRLKEQPIPNIRQEVYINDYLLPIDQYAENEVLQDADPLMDVAAASNYSHNDSDNTAHGSRTSDHVENVKEEVPLSMEDRAELHFLLQDVSIEDDILDNHNDTNANHEEVQNASNDEQIEYDGDIETEDLVFEKNALFPKPSLVVLTKKQADLISGVLPFYEAVSNLIQCKTNKKKQGNDNFFFNFS